MSASLTEAERRMGHSGTRVAPFTVIKGPKVIDISESRHYAIEPTKQNSTTPP